MKILALETGTDACSAALWVNGEMVELFEIAPRRHSDLILAMVDQLLKMRDLSLQELTAIGVGVGPGSFMGVRLAVGVAQGLAFGVGIPVVPISSLQALALRAFQQLGYPHIAAAWDARMDEIYWGAYQKIGNEMRPVKEDCLSAPPSIVLPDGGEWVLVGNAWQEYQLQLPQLLQRESYLIHPSAKAVAELAARAYREGRAESALQLEPQYIRQRVAFRPGGN
ncbi:MAG: tRNA (adenosine(37)-N6)-threonylcarbamoyltransferase complex dimerization subunit type 1 TsaB [Coxiella sp. RIFCSPHIGHO2_12_FULL_42_15]|nr:MAG: tRNA (adenosine(37)-N6)-threonylcarbamoyltransferase complex dimerization subunit type 1 TsaB [Coxiella sp. RIFCSPHIGHO2_12_FULL_42_15]